jgi:hypothetical protein
LLGSRLRRKSGADNLAGSGNTGLANSLLTQTTFGQRLRFSGGARCQARWMELNYYQSKLSGRLQGAHRLLAGVTLGGFSIHKSIM